MGKEYLTPYKKPHEMYLRTFRISGRVDNSNGSSSKQKGKSVQTTYSVTWYVEGTNFMDDGYLIGHIKNVIGSICDRISPINTGRVRLYRMMVDTIDFTVQASIPMDLFWGELITELQSL